VKLESNKNTRYAQEKTGQSFHDHQMFYKGFPVASCSLRKGLQQFIDWLAVRKPVVLIAHSCRVFDSYRLLRQCQCSGIAITQLKEAVIGFADTLPYFRRLYPEIANHQLSAPSDYLLTVAFDAHNAAIDVLRRLCDCSHLEDIHDFTFTVDAVMQSLIRHDAAVENCQASACWSTRLYSGIEMYLLQGLKTLKDYKPLYSDRNLLCCWIMSRCNDVLFSG
jgi:hypothetical protein